jgi:hypothetical protein
MPDEERNGQPNESDNCYPLDDAAIALFAEGKRQLEMVNAQMVGAMNLYIKQHRLEGQWRLAENGRELERAAPVPVQR